MKVLGLVNNAPPGSRVGAFIAMHRVFKGFVEAGHEVRVLVECRINDYTHEGVPYEQEGPFLAEHGRRSDVILSISGGSGHGHLAAVHLGKPSVVFAHSSSPGFREQLERHARPALVVFNSQSLADMADYDGPHVVCRPGINPADFQLRKPGDHITLINLTEEKGAHTFDQLARHMPERRFLAVVGGYGEQLDVWRRNITIQPTTIHMRDEVYARTRILLMPSLLETWGLVGIEAMSCGIPVIAHPTPGIVEALGDAGIYVDREDLDGWIDAVERLDNARSYAAASRKAKARATLVSEDQGVAHLVKAVEELVG